MDTTERRELLQRLLEDLPDGTSALDLATQLGVTERTVYRDVGALRAQGVQVVAQRGRNGGIRLAGRRSAPLA